MDSLLTSQNKWFADRRGLFVKEMVKEFHTTFIAFQALYDSYIKGAGLPFTNMEMLVGTESDKGILWRLKDRCHQIWRGTEPKDDLNGCLFDWVMGSIFHEAMKLKENIYMFEYYGPLAEEMREKHTPTVRFCGMECKRFMDRTAKEINQQIENLGFMFGRANYLLRTMLPAQTDNDLLIRFLLENREIPEELWSESLIDILTDIYGAPEKGFCIAGRGYLRGHWHERARDAYTEALHLNGKCEEAGKILAQLSSLLENGPPNRDTIV